MRKNSTQLHICSTRCNDKNFKGYIGGEREFKWKSYDSQVEHMCHDVEFFFSLKVKCPWPHSFFLARHSWLVTRTHHSLNLQAYCSSFQSRCHTSVFVQYNTIKCHENNRFIFRFIYLSDDATFSPVLLATFLISVEQPLWSLFIWKRIRIWHPAGFGRVQLTRTKPHVRAVRQWYCTQSANIVNTNSTWKHAQCFQNFEHFNNS